MLIKCRIFHVIIFLFIDKGEKKIRFSPGVNAKTTCNIQLLEGYGGN